MDTDIQVHRFHGHDRFAAFVENAQIRHLAFAMVFRHKRDHMYTRFDITVFQIAFTFTVVADIHKLHRLEQKRPVVALQFHHAREKIVTGFQSR